MTDNSSTVGETPILDLSFSTIPGNLPDNVGWFQNAGRNGVIAFSGSDPLNAGIDPSLLNGLEAITVAVRVRADAIDGGIFSTAAAPDARNDDLGLRFDSRGAEGGGTNVIAASITTDAGTTHIESSSNAAVARKWLHVTLTWTSGGQLELYVDGKKDSLSYSGNALGGSIAGVDLLNIGIDPNGAIWDGRIDEFAIYDRRLSDAEIERLVQEQGLEPAPSNTPPIAGDDAATFAAGEGGPIDVLANDTDPDGGPLQIVSVTQPGSGSASIVQGKVVYRPDDGFAGTDSLEYTVRDPAGAEDTARVTVTVQPDDDTGGGTPVPNAPPVAANDSAMVMGGDAAALDVLANDADPDGGPLQIVAVSRPDHGVAYVQDGKVHFLADHGYAGTDSLIYTVRDAAGAEDTATVALRVMEMDHGMPHDEPEMAMEHHMLMQLVPRSAATHVAVKNGSWFDPDTWSTGTVPGDGATALIPTGVAVLYDGQSAARVTAVRVEGTMTWATDTDTKLMVETLLSVPGARLEIGTETDPVTASAEIVFHSTTPGELPMMSMARGLVTHGGVSIVGEDKLDHTTLAGNVSAGDTELVLSEIPAGWAVGDTIVVGGTYYDATGSDADNSRFHDEVLTITAIDGQTIRFVNTDTGGTSFRFDHATPEGYDGLDIHVGNLSRSITFASEFGNETAIPDRGHVMFMHSKDVVVKHAAFDGLGRSDKNLLVDDPGTNVDGTLGDDGTEMGTNPRGRYAVHFHRNLLDTETSDPSVAEGLAVNGSPGWGIVHHDSHVEIIDSVVFDVVGSGIAAEAGNEIGRWENNLTIKTTGDDDPAVSFNGGTERIVKFDFGFNGEAYWIQGAPLISFVDNVAHSANGAALEIFTEVDGNLNKDIHGDVIPVAHLAPEQRALYLAAGYSPTDEIDISGAIATRITGFEAINSRKGIETWNHLRNDDGTGRLIHGEAHEMRTQISEFELWGIFGEGIFTQYSTQIDFRDGLIIGIPDDPVDILFGINGAAAGRGINSNDPSNDLGFYDITIDGFAAAMRIPWEAGMLTGDLGPLLDFNATEISGLTVRNVDSVFVNLVHESWSDMRFPNTAILENLTLGEGTPTSAAPIAAFNAENVGGTVARLDAGASYDPDPPAWARTSDNAIAAYGWDFDRDGIIDAFGRWAVHDFGRTGTHDVDLTVWDGNGQSTTATRAVTVTGGPYTNLLHDGAFAAGQPDDFSHYTVTAALMGQGWFTTGWTLEDGAMAAPTNRSFENGLFQVQMDNAAMRGVQTLSFDLDYSYIDTSQNLLKLAVWGFDTEFQHQAGTETVTPLDAMPLEAERLLFTRLGTTDGWENQSFDIDFGDGYKFISVSLLLDRPERGSGPVRNGDAVLVDNFILGDNDGPAPGADSFHLDGDPWARLDVLGNDMTRDGSGLTLTAVENAILGSVRVAGTKLLYDPAKGAHGTETLTYTVTDSAGRKATAEAEVRVSPISTEGLILDYAFDEGSGRSTTNLESTDETGPTTLFNGGQWRDGVRGSAAEFDGFSYIPLDDDRFDGRGPWGDSKTHERSVSLWFQADDLAAGGRQYLYQEGGEAEGIYLMIEDGLLVAGGQSDSARWKPVSVATSAIREDAWHHVALTIDGDDRTLAAYLDGDLFGTANAKSYFRHYTPETLGNGNRYGSLDEGFDGAIDSLLVYDRVVTDDEIGILATI